MYLHMITANDLAVQRDWSLQTFGPGTRTNGVLDHIAKEVEEVRAAPNDVTEWVDLLILAFDGALRAGFSPAQITEAYHRKMKKNFERRWPDWREFSEDVAIEHIRDGE
jgi:hypothetical protein